MLLMMAPEFVATGAPLIFWFHGLSEGKSDWPSKLSRLRSSSLSIDGPRPCARARRERPSSGWRRGRSMTRIARESPGGVGAVDGPHRSLVDHRRRASSTQGRDALIPHGRRSVAPIFVGS